ncbi:Na+/H+ antiporter subunit D [soil metagenome]
MSPLVLLPVIVPLAGAALGLAAWESLRAQRIVAVAASLGLLVAGIVLLAAVERHGVLTLQLGDWPAPFGITFVADLFSAILVVLTGVLGLAVTVYSLATIDEGRQRHGYFPLLLVLLAGVSGTFVTGDLFNLYVWFEVLLIASFVLLALGGERAQLEGALKYVAINLVASAILLVTIGVLYGLTGTVNMADLSVKLVAVEQDGLVTGLAVMLLVAFGIKAALVPLFFWLPASYHTPPVAVAAIFAGLLTKVGIYALVRVFTLLFPSDALTLQLLILGLAALTMVVGVLGAIAQHEMRRLLAFLIVADIGFLVMGLGFFTVAALAGVIYFRVHVAIAKATLFLLAGAVKQVSGTLELAATGGLWVLRPGLAVLFGLAALSLAGVPPFSGFLAKLSLVQAGLAVDQLVMVGVALAVSVLILYAVLKVWNATFWKPPPERALAGAMAAPTDPHGGGRLEAAVLLPIAGLVACSVALSVGAGPVFALMDRAAQELLDPSAYLAAVMRTLP